jgi:diguanylate cyclase (GGDEF)-like protein
VFATVFGMRAEAHRQVMHTDGAVNHDPDAIAMRRLTTRALAEHKRQLRRRRGRPSPWKSFFLTVSLIVVLSVSVLFIGIAANDQRAIEAELDTRAHTIVDSIRLAREWNARYGGVYVERAPGSESNPYVKAPDIEAGNGKTYTSKNHALMTREISEIAEREGSFRFRIASLKPLNPRNAPDAFEAAALRSFETGTKAVAGRATKDGSIWYRYMAPLYVEESCLECHAEQGYRVGDVRGGVSVSFNIDQAARAVARSRWMTIVLYVLTVLVLLGILWRLVSLLQRRLASAEARIRHMAVTDALTGLKNRRYLVQVLRSEFVRSRRYGSPISCVMFDVDHFKRVNDTHGHDAGDAVLKALAAATRDLCRDSDALGRYGGEEFLMILPETDGDGARAMGDRIRHAIEDLRVEVAGKCLGVTVSVGTATATPGDGAFSPRVILKWADDALYRAKRAGRNRIESAA